MMGRAIAILALFAAVGLYLLQPPGSGVLRATTTTSLYATGLLDQLAEEFESLNPGVKVEFIAVGSGEALRRAAAGDADLVLTHAPSLEKRYLEEGVLLQGAIFAYNYFVLVGPREDPAGIAGLDPVEAMRRIYEAGEAGRAVFVSRGDSSGTHVRELMLWRLAGLDPRGKPWYVEVGAGMPQAFMVAGEKRAYTLSDTGTYAKFRSKLPDLSPLVERGGILLNMYSAYPVNPDKVPGVNLRLAEEFVEFLTSERGQKVIAEFVAEGSQTPLFYPASQRPEEELKTAWEALSED